MKTEILSLYADHFKGSGRGGLSVEELALCHARFLSRIAQTSNARENDLQKYAQSIVIELREARAAKNDGRLPVTGVTIERVLKARKNYLESARNTLVMDEVEFPKEMPIFAAFYAALIKFKRNTKAGPTTNFVAAFVEKAASVSKYASSLFRMCKIERCSSFF